MNATAPSPDELTATLSNGRDLTGERVRVQFKGHVYEGTIQRVTDAIDQDRELLIDVDSRTPPLTVWPTRDGFDVELRGDE